MKRFFALAGFLLGVALCMPVSAQININISSQPLWGPAGYDNAQYYYFPDRDAYYSVADKQYIYSNNGQWVKTTSRPVLFQNYDLNNAYKVVINEPQPYLRHEVYKTKYVGYKGKKGQPIIRNSSDPRYYVIEGHPKKVKKNNAGSASSVAKSRASSNSAVAKSTTTRVKTYDNNNGNNGNGNGNGNKNDKGNGKNNGNGNGKNK